MRGALGTLCFRLQLTCMIAWHRYRTAYPNTAPGLPGGSVAVAVRSDKSILQQAACLRCAWHLKQFRARTGSHVVTTMPFKWCFTVYFALSSTTIAPWVLPVWPMA